MIQIKTEEEFNELIKEGLVLVDFYAVWCGPCRMLSPIVDEIAKEHEELKVLKVDVDNLENLSRKYGIMSIPTLKVFKDGKEVKTSIGYINKNELEDLLK